MYLSFSHTSSSEQELSCSFRTGLENYVIGRVNSEEEVEEKGEESMNSLCKIPAKLGRYERIGHTDTCPMTEELSQELDLEGPI